MFDVSDPRNLAIRAANFVQREHAPSYVALRYLLGSVAPYRFGRWLGEYVSRKITSRRPLSYLQAPFFKSLNDDGVPMFRDFFIGSPTTLLTEAWFLSALSLLDQFTAPSHVYSYRWPHLKSGRHFRFFFDGYSERDQKIEQLLLSSDHLVACVFDIKSFYPSVDRSRVSEIFMRKIVQEESLAKHRGHFEWLISELFQRTNSSGIPIGSAISHVLGNVYLEKIDNELGDRYGERYFRYVDDIIVVSKESEIGEVHNVVKGELEGVGLAVNEDKIDQVWVEAWQQRDLLKDTSRPHQSFDQFIKRLTAYLAFQPNQFSELSEKLAEDGFNIPLKAVQSISGYTKFRRFFENRWSFLPLHERVSLAFEDTNTLVATARELRKDFQEYRNNLRDLTPPLSGMRRRWWVRSWRYVLNRSLYLEPSKTFPTFLQGIDVPELHDVRLMVQSLATGDFTDLIGTPGRALKAAAEIFSQNLEVGSARVRLPDKWAPRLKEGLVTLGIFGLIDKPDLSKWGELPSDDLAYLQFAFSDVGRKRNFVENIHLDEITSLSLFHQDDGPGRVLRERFDDDEEVHLSGLQVGEYEYL